MILKDDYNKGPGPVEQRVRLGNILKLCELLHAQLESRWVDDLYGPSCYASLFPDPDPTRDNLDMTTPEIVRGMTQQLQYETRVLLRYLDKKRRRKEHLRLGIKYFCDLWTELTGKEVPINCDQHADEANGPATRFIQELFRVLEPEVKFGTIRTLLRETPGKRASSDVIAKFAKEFSRWAELGPTDLSRSQS